MRLLGLICAAALMAAGSAVLAQAPTAGDKPRTVQLSRVVVKLAPGVQWLTLSKGMFCGNPAIQTWPGGTTEFRVATVMDTFRERFAKAGLAPEQEASLFEPQGVSPSEFALGGTITDQTVKACAPDASPQGINNVKGDLTLTVDWQLYSRVEKQVVANAHTTVTYSAKDPAPGGMTAMLNKAFAMSFDQLAADPGIRKALAGRALAENELVKPPQRDALLIPSVRGNAIVPPAQAPASVVVIYAGSALGSGFLISRDGYVLTDAHVVGDAPRVRVRWADGSEGVADVLRTSKERDVAILKTDAKGHIPLALREEPPETGATVWAVGAPEGQRFEGTLTKGVISGSRIFQGFNYLQSDVTAGHGSSGGPLLDEYGRVIALTDSYRNATGQTSSGIALFTPVKDAVAFLGLELR